MVLGCVGATNLHICKGTINAERYTQILEQHILPSRQHLFRSLSAYFSKTMQSCILPLDSVAS